MRYATIDDAIRLIKSLGKGCFLAKTDIKSAFRIIPVSPKIFSSEWNGRESSILTNAFPWGAPRRVIYI